MEDALTPFSRETEEVLRRARITEAMPVAKRRRLKAAVLARLAAGGIAFAPSGVAAATGFWATTVGGAVKGIAAFAVVASLGVGGYMATRSSTPAKLSAAAVPARNAVVEPRAAVAPEPAAPVVRESAAPAPRRAARAPERAQKAPPVELVFVPPPAPPAPAAAAPLERSSTLAEETRLLREADRALRGGSPDTAIALLDEHAQRFPDGVLAPERSAERMVALCQLGRADASTATRFLANRSSSPLAARIRQACGVTSK
jgi:hypothetical protein